MPHKILPILLMSTIVLQLEAQSITNYTTADGLVSDFVECIDIDMNDNVWIGTSNGVQMFDGSSWTLYNTISNPGMASNNIKEITCTSDGYVWVGTDYGVSAFSLISSNWVTFNSANGLVSNQVKSIDESLDDSDGVWIGTSQGVSFYSGFSWLSYSSPDLHWSGVNTTAFDSFGSKWFASPLAGITHFDGTNFTNYDTAHGLLSQNVTALFIDGDDNKWIGTDLGMSVLDGSNTYFVEHIDMYSLPPPHDSINPVVDIAMDAYGRIWTGVYVGYLAEGGVAYWNGAEWEDFHVSDGLAGPNVKGIAIDSENNVWVATSTGISKISGIPSFINEMNISEVNLFPNPSNNVVYLENKDKFIQGIGIYNNIGSLMYSNTSSQEKYNINVSSFSRGVYYICFHHSNGITTKKLILR